MKPIATMECEDCGRFIVAEENCLSVFIIDRDIYAITRCVYCDRVLTQSVPLNLVPNLAGRGVKVFYWNDGSEVTLQDMRDMING